MSHWTDEGAYEVAPGVHRIPLPLPMDGLRAVNVYAIETEEGLTLVDGGWAVEESRTQLEQSLDRIDRKVGDITRFLVTHVHRDHYTQAVTVRREFGSHVSLGLGDKPTLDIIRDQQLEYDPTVPHLVRAGATKVAEDWTRVMGGRRPDLDHWTAPDTWLDGDLTLDVGTRADRRRPHAGPHPGPLRLRRHSRPGCCSPATTCCRRSPRPSGSSPPTRSSRWATSSASLAKVRALPDLALLPAHGPVTASSARPGRRAARAPRGAARPVPGGGAGRLPDGVRRRPRAALDPAHPEHGRPRPVQLRARHPRDDGPPRAARRTRRRDPHRAPTASLSYHPVDVVLRVPPGCHTGGSVRTRPTGSSLSPRASNRDLCGIVTGTFGGIPSIGGSGAGP